MSHDCSYPRRPPDPRRGPRQHRRQRRPTAWSRSASGRCPRPRASSSPWCAGATTPRSPASPAASAASAPSGHTLASVKATEDALGIEVSEQSWKLRELLKHAENFDSHVLHINILVAPDLLGAPSVFPLVATHADVVARALRLKRLAHEWGSLIGGRTTHPMSVVPGGMAAVPTTKELKALQRAAPRRRARTWRRRSRPSPRWPPTCRCSTGPPSTSRSPTTRTTASTTATSSRCCPTAPSSATRSPTTSR